ncbi:hypothetical protein DV735_g3706, partial [Chaetothyriales sp. CBS 134920]
MSRQRENRVLPSQTRANGSVFGHGGPALPSGEFFTDSLLEDTPSRIPSPTSTQKSKLAVVSAKQRRAIYTTGTTAATATGTMATALPPTTRPLEAGRLGAGSGHAPKKSATLSYTGRLPLSLKREDVTTPQSADSRREFRTSTSSTLSTPPRALTEVYQRIDDEQALAAAEREDRSSEGGSDRHGELPLDATDTSAAAKPGDVDMQLTGTLSEGTGMSFLKGLTDQNIANSITPAVSSHVKDMRKLGISTKPIAHSDSSLDGRNKPPQRVFQMSLPNSHQPTDELKVKDGGAGRDGGEDGDDGYSTDEDLRKREVAFKFSQLAKKMNLKSSQAGSDEAGGRQTPRPKKGSIDGGDENQRPNTQTQHQRAPSFDSQASSSVNWGAVDEDMPMRSIEPAGNEPSGSVWSQSSPGRVKRWDNDFTGVSFQVSDSPPVKSRAKPAMATQEDARQAATRLPHSIGDDTALQTDVNDKELTTDTRPDSAGEQDPKAPGVIFRSSTTSQAPSKAGTQPPSKAEKQPPPKAESQPPSKAEKQPPPKAESQPPFLDSRSRSHDLIQRLARLGSSTPRSSPRALKEDVKREVAEEIDVAAKDEATEEKISKKPIVAATPKVTGAWTDTILPEPDTAKTVKSEAQQPQQQPSGYVQTPHVKAGGWIDTPLLSRSERASATTAGAMAPIEDVTEELDTNVRGGDGPTVTDTLVLGNDTLASLDSVLDKTWQNADELIKLSSVSNNNSNNSNITTTGEDDGEVAGSSGEADTTKQLEILLLGTLQTLQSNIQSARQGISKLEQEVARDVAASASSPSSNTAVAEAAASLQQQQAQEKALLDLLARLPPPQEDKKTSRSTTSSRRFSSSNPTMTRIQTQLQIHRTHLVATLGLVVCWYLLECTLAELIAHPV